MKNHQNNNKHDTGMMIYSAKNNKTHFLNKFVKIKLICKLKSCNTLKLSVSYM